MKVNNICIFCKGIADTREHIPAKQFFKGVPDKPLITVPSCKNCNIGFQKDEDFFKKTYPATIRPQAKDIVRTWLYYTILRCEQLTGKTPWSEAWIMGYGLDE